ncbi:hypothetical protein [hymenopteran rhabdo-related virus 109]|uniref:Uncharacterized protein n=1 Tax=hymenopteran rhabdo-related virus 109 TaxID=2847803 RepID=A0A7D7F2U7_9RHAB|nr:hypothetical protein QKO60_gp2 [hymenopteran rhabdo-related virus 109]QMP82141.1 hypothetical protein [hymenopteran rhabdo-related virus 109]
MQSGNGLRKSKENYTVNFGHIMSRVAVPEALEDMMKESLDRMPEVPYHEFLEGDTPEKEERPPEGSEVPLDPPCDQGIGAVGQNTGITQMGSNSYRTLVNDSGYLDLPSGTALARLLATVENSTDPYEAEFWRAYSPTLISWQMEREFSLIEMVLKHSLRGAEAICIFIQGVTAGMQRSKAKEGHKLIENLSLMVEQLAVETRTMKEEKIAHQQQISAFVKQVNQASTNINNAMKAAEDHQLRLVQMETIHYVPPQASAKISRAQTAFSSTQITETSDASEDDMLQDETRIPVPLISEEGTYVANGITVRINKGVLTTVIAHRPGLAPLQKAVGMPAPAAYVLFNKELAGLEELGTLNPAWADFLRGPEPNKGKMLLGFIQDMKSQEFQWKKMFNSDSRKD